MKSRTVLVPRLGVVVVAGLGVWWSCISESAAPAVTRVTLHQAAETLLYLPLYIAIDQGYLADEGVEVQVVTAGGDSQAFAALASGQADFAQGDPTFVAISAERGGPGIVVASVLDRVAFWGVTFDDAIDPFADPAGFAGRTVVTYPEPNTAFVVQERLLDKAGLEPGRDSFIVPATFGTELGPIQAGLADLAVSIEPTVSQAVANGGKVVYSYADAWGPFLLTGLMTTREYAESHRGVVQGVVVAYERALQLLREDPAAAAAVGRANFPEVPAEVIDMAIKRLVESAVFPRHAGVDLQSWRAALQIRVLAGDLGSTDHDGLVDMSFGMDARDP